MRPLRVLLALSLVLVMVAGAAAQAPITLWINGRQVAGDVPPLIVQDRVMVPLRLVSEQLDAQVDWDGTTRTVTVTSPGLTLRSYLEAMPPAVNTMGDAMAALTAFMDQQSAGTLSAGEAAQKFEDLAAWASNGLSLFEGWEVPRKAQAFHGLFLQTLVAYQATAKLLALRYELEVSGQLTQALAVLEGVRRVSPIVFARYEALVAAWQSLTATGL